MAGRRTIRRVCVPSSQLVRRRKAARTTAVPVAFILHQSEPGGSVRSHWNGYLT